MSSAATALRILHIGGYWRGENDIVRQMMLGLVQAGHSVYEYNTDEHRYALDAEGRPYDRGAFGPVWLKWEYLKDPVTAFQPALIVCNAGGLSFPPEVSRHLRKHTRLIGIALSDPEVFEPTTSRIAQNFGCFFTNAATSIPRYQEIGVDAKLLPVATNDQFFRPVPARPEFSCDVLILGSAHANRVEPVRALAEAFHVHLYGEGWDVVGLESRGLVFGYDSLSALNSAKVTVVFSKTKSGHANVKVGLFDFLAAGAFVMTDYQPELRQFFDLDNEIASFTSIPEMIAKVRYFLAHDGERAKIRDAGRARVLRDHTWRSVWPRILPVVDTTARSSAASCAVSVTLREVTWDDCRKLYEWRMHEPSRRMFRHTDLVPYGEHERFVRCYLERTTPETWFVVEAGGVAVGTIAIVGFSGNGEECELSRLAIASEHRANGYATEALRLALCQAKAKGVRRLNAEVNSANQPSLHIFAKHGFTEYGRRADGPRTFIQLELDLV